MNHVLILSILFSASLFAQPQISVVASIPDLGDMAKQIGGDHVNVVVLSTGREDLHAVPARPSFLPKLNRADVVLSLGLDAEHAWLPALCAEARNSRIREDAEGWIETWKGIDLMDVPVRLDRSEGEQHPEGNPHYNIGPQCGTVMVKNITEVFCDIQPGQCALFRSNAEKYGIELEALVAELKGKGAGLQGIAVIDYHPDIPYLCSFYGMRPVGSIEPKAGIAPTAGHLRALTETGKKTGVRLVIYNQSQNDKIPLQLAGNLGWQAVRIANAVGAEKGITTWAGLQRHNLTVLLEGMAGADRP